MTTTTTTTIIMMMDCGIDRYSMASAKCNMFKHALYGYDKFRAFTKYFAMKIIFCKQSSLLTPLLSLIINDSNYTDITTTTTTSSDDYITTTTAKDTKSDKNLMNDFYFILIFIKSL